LQARGTQRIDEIKRDFKEGRKTLKSASAQMYALITTWAPQYAGSRFPMLVRRIYKMRWQIETAFRDNEIHKAIWRSNYDGTRFIGEFGRYLLFNNWQIAKVEDFRKDRFPFQMYRDELIDKESGCLNL
jgi:IS4 transposase